MTKSAKISVVVGVILAGVAAALLVYLLGRPSQGPPPNTFESLGCAPDQVKILASPFFMGCEPEDKLCRDTEKPRHQVRLKDYCLDIHEVTNQQYARYLTKENPDNKCFGSHCVRPEHPKYSGLHRAGGAWVVDRGFENRPVVFVSWWGARAFCQAQQKRLPTSAEWEKAAKGGPEHRIYPWGDQWRAHAANHYKSGDPFEQGPLPHTTPVGFYDGSKRGAFQTADGRSRHGVFDLAGNVFEWPADWWSAKDYATAPREGWVDPKGPADMGCGGPCKEKVIRGGSWADDPPDDPLPRLRASEHTSKDTRDTTFKDNGFRCAR